MKIDLLGPVHPYRGGIAHYTARLYRELERAGHDVRVVNLRRQYPGALFPGATQTDASARAFDVPSERLLDSMNPLSWVATGRNIARRRPDLLVVQWWHPFFAPSFATAAAIARRAGVRVVFVCHNVRPHEASPVDVALLRLAYASADRFVVHADAEVDRLRSLVRHPDVAVSPHPVYDLFEDDGAPDRDAARAELGVDGDCILFFGLIRHYKGLDLLMQAMPAVLARRQVHLYVAGECYDDIAVYRGLIERLRLGPHVTLDARYIPNEDVPTLMAAADVVVLPYRHATQSGIAQVAYACGRAVITTAVGGLPDVVHHGRTGLLVPPDDVHALSDAILRFYDDDLRDTLEQGVHQARADLGWDRLAAAITGEAP